ncbi:MAG: hypothetical protein IPM35_18135 [Myxococcales bacterium]|nr:hypothetical protein [Myxococcales bacterium]
MLGRLAIASCLLALGCGGGESASTSGGTGGAGGSAGAATGGSAGKAPCSEDHGPGAVCVMEVKGRTVDAQGAPLGQISTSVCGFICWYGESDATGAFTVSIGERIVPTEFSTLPHGRPSRTSFYFALPEVTSESVEVGDLPLLELPPSGPSLVVWHEKQGAPAQTVTSGELTLEVSAGTQVKLDVEDVALGDEGKQFRALGIPAAKRPAFAGEALGLGALWALTPFEAAVIDEQSGAPALARVSADNSLGLPADTAVEWLALGSYLFADWVTPAAFEVVATGKVSADGARIEMDAGQGVRYLTWLGVRKKP